MNALHQARAAYGAAQAPTRTPRGTEYDALARITARLKSARDKGAGGFADLTRALDENRRLWTTLAADLAQPNNGLPDALRAQLLSLANFSITHGAKVLRGTADAESLIEINTALMRGLAPVETAE